MSSLAPAESNPSDQAAPARNLLEGATLRTHSFFDLGVESNRILLSEALKLAANEVLDMIRPGVLSQFSALEILSQELVDLLPWQKGNWFRPLHNYFVPLAMLQLIKSGEASRDMILVAQWHDCGYSHLDVAETSSGKSWAKEDLRQKHMQLGEELFRSHMSKFIGKDRPSESRLEQLASFIGVHDNPYIGQEIFFPEARILRDADRIFVPSILSFLKDAIAYGAEAASRNEAYTFEDHMLRRLQDFYFDYEQVPESVFESCPELVDRFQVKVSKKTEPQNTKMGAMIIDYILSKRAMQLQELSACSDMETFVTFFKEKAVQEFSDLLHFHSR